MREFSDLRLPLLPRWSQLPSPSPLPPGSTGSSLTAHQSLPPAPDTWLQPGWGPVRGKVPLTSLSKLVSFSEFP